MTRRTLMLVGLALVVLVNWAVHRVRPRVQELRALDEARARLSSEAGAAPSPAARTAAERGAEDLEDEVARVRARLQELEARIAPREEVPELQVALADLAADAGLRLDAEEPLGPPGARRTAWTLRGSFGALCAFLERVPGLPARVVVSDLEVEAPKDTEGAPLVIRLKVTL